MTGARTVRRVTYREPPGYDRTAPLAQLLGRPAPTYGARYAPHVEVYGPPRPRWHCRACGDLVTDRYLHESTRHRAPWFGELAALAAVAEELFGDPADRA